MFGIAKSWSKPGDTAAARVPRRNPCCCNSHSLEGRLGQLGSIRAHTLPYPASGAGGGRGTAGGNICGLVSVPGHRSSCWLGLVKEQLRLAFCV